jgi:hypothetical protein
MCAGIAFAVECFKTLLWLAGFESLIHENGVRHLPRFIDAANIE